MGVYNYYMVETSIRIVQTAITTQTSIRIYDHAYHDNHVIDIGHVMQYHMKNEHK